MTRREMFVYKSMLKISEKEATGKGKLLGMGKLRLKDRRVDTTEGVEHHPGADLERQNWLLMQCGVLSRNENSRSDYSGSWKRRR
jgi:hypothetical protein